VEDAFEISSTRLFRLVHLERGRIKSGRLDCTRRGPVDFEVDGTSWPITVGLAFSAPLRASGLSILADTSFWLLPTDLTFGGERWWFVCPPCAAGVRSCTWSRPDTTSGTRCRGPVVPAKALYIPASGKVGESELSGSSGRH
jgi:hypothetical protein